MSIVLMLSRQRCGTGALASVLERHRDIFYCGEILDASSEIRPFFGWLENQTISNGDNFIAEKFEEFIHQMLEEDMVNLIDIKYNSLGCFGRNFRSFCEIPWILEYLSQIPIPIINIRRNPLQCYLSAKNAEAHQIFHTDDPKKVSHKKVDVDMGDFINYYNLCVREDRAMASFFDSYQFSTILNYEEMFDPTGMISPYAISKISDLLNLELSGLDRRPAFVKQSPVAIVDKLRNIEDVINGLVDINRGLVETIGR